MSSIHITKKAWTKMSKIIGYTKNQYGFLYSASSGGCNGFNFKLDLLDNKTYLEISHQKYLTVLKERDATVYVDPVSEMFLLGTTIDYITQDYSNGEFESRFNFIINKDTMTGCGCGISFTPKY